MTQKIETQQYYVRILERIDSIFRKHEIQYWLDGGTLLCAYRDGDLEYEHDIDIGVYGEDFKKICGISKELICDTKWRLSSSKIYHTLYLDKIVSPKYTLTLHCDMIQWYKHEDIRTGWGVRLPFTVPSEMLDKFTEIKIHKLSDTMFFAPYDTERYLEMYFGKEDWKKKIDTTEYHYLSLDQASGKKERYEINKYNHKCFYFWKKKLGYVPNHFKDPSWTQEELNAE